MVRLIEELEPLMRSKYVQSKIGNTYKQAEQFLKNGRKVMFVGTSCQIAGLKRFLRKEYDNLLAVDFICHGVPSPRIWRKYLEEIKSSRSEAAGKNTVLLSSIFNENIFMKGFLANLYLRPSCYKCKAKNGAANSDITIADYWGIQRFHPDFDDDKGVSAVFIHTCKGKGIFNDLSSRFSIIDSNLKEATLPNPPYFRSCQEPKNILYFGTFIKKRNQFMRQ